MTDLDQEIELLKMALRDTVSDLQTAQNIISSYRTALQAAEMCFENYTKVLKVQAEEIQVLRGIVGN